VRKEMLGRDLPKLKLDTPELADIDSEDSAAVAAADFFLWESLHNLILTRWQSERPFGRAEVRFF
jgi:hypothetical protein